MILDGRGSHFSPLYFNLLKNSADIKKTTAYQTHFCFINIGSNMHSFCATAIWNPKISSETPCISRKFSISPIDFESTISYWLWLLQKCIVFSSNQIWHFQYQFNSIWIIFSNVITPYGVNREHYYSAHFALMNHTIQPICFHCHPVIIMICPYSI